MLICFRKLHRLSQLTGWHCRRQQLNEQVKAHKITKNYNDFRGGNFISDFLHILCVVGEGGGEREAFH